MRWMEEELSRIKKENLYRERKKVKAKDFCSNDYLALRDHPLVVRSAKEALKEAGLGSGASQLVSGYTRYHEELERELSRFKKTQSCILFGSGYLANVGSIPALAGEGDLILSDELNHASIIDGVRLSKAKKKIFKHKDYDALRAFLDKNRKKYKKVLIVTDTVFSMDGDIADIPRLVEIAKRYDCMLYLDEAHATGVLGSGGLSHFGLPHEEFIVLMGTLSKALGSYGAFVCGTKTLTDYLTNRARSAIFSTSIPSPLCAGAKTALRIVSKNPSLVKRLRKTERKIVRILKELGLPFRYHGTPIIPIILGDESLVLKFKDALLSEGVFVQAIRYPTVPRGSARLRLTASLRYTDEDLAHLKRALLRALRKTNLNQYL
ncbi:MAG: 8-amino-7-oxononanoate synthase [Aquificae bacterium]|nr:8-amino-7-oxononanoate synthase [Aquificota bacterium]